MPATTEQELPESIKSYWVKAQSAVDLRNYKYAITLLQDVLKEEPHFLSARRLLRKAEIAESKGGKKLFNFGGFGKGSSLLKKDPKAAMEAAEKAMTDDPYNKDANILLKDAALAMEDEATAQFALENLADGHPKDTKVQHLLARFYVDHDMPEKGVEVYRRILRVDPSDSEANKGEKDASAKASIRKGSWEKEGGFREKLADAEESQELEEANRGQLTGEARERRLENLYEKAHDDPRNQNYPQEIARLLESKEDWSGALQWYEYLNDLTDGGDPGIARRISELRAKVAEADLREKQRQLREDTLDPDTRAKLEKEVSELEDQLNNVRMQSAADRIKRNPTDLQLRLEYGEMLVEAGNYSEAIPELQKAQKSPNAKIRAKSLLGQCYRKKKMYPLAIKTLQEAREGIAGMDATKKEVTYTLGLIYEENGDKQKSLEMMTEIYEVDYEYRDVAKRVEGSYE
jgi:tetratricopeptide (TPR) repeat protein